MLQPRIVFYSAHYEHVIVSIMCTFGCTSQVCYKSTRRELERGKEKEGVDDDK